MEKNINIMSFLTPKKDLIYLEDTMTLRQAIEKMRIHRYTVIPMINADNGVYRGSVSEGDLLRRITEADTFDLYECENIPVVSVVRKDYIPAVSVDTDFDTLLNMVTNQNYVPVTDDRGILMGIITRRSVITYLKNLL